MTSTITVLDGSGDSTEPVAVSGIGMSASSANVVHELIEPGSIAVTLGGDLPRSGTLTMIYTDDAEADAARVLLGRPATFALQTDERPVTDLTFVRVGDMSAAVHDTVSSLWVLTVGVQEIVP